jgi:cellobiose transport system permease protein
VTTYTTRAPQDTRGNWKTYLGLGAVLILSAFPVYWMFVIATSTDAAVSQIPPSVIPGSQLFKNLNEVFTMREVYFTASLINSVIVSSVITLATLFFCSLAGFAFAKLHFPARNALMFVVILTLTVPNQLGVVALYILMGKLGWNGTRCRTSWSSRPASTAR